MGIPDLNNKLLKLGNQLVGMQYEIYIAGIADGRNGGSIPSLKEFAKNAKNIHFRGKQLSKTVVMNGERTDTVIDA
jgi:hypothetical protein